MSTPNAAQLADENRYLNDELNRVETVLNLTRAEKDELSIRYNALSDRVSFFFNDHIITSIENLVKNIHNVLTMCFNANDSQALESFFKSHVCLRINGDRTVVSRQLGLRHLNLTHDTG